ncbi:MAG: hypothetical protein GQ532_15350 [Methylomarinum sp.]|nr:hypothetical protein [Methylomarinum sp.]
MAFSLTEANLVLAEILNSSLSKTDKQIELKNLVSQLDISATGDVTILYGGPGHRPIIDDLLTNGPDNLRICR